MEIVSYQESEEINGIEGEIEQINKRLRRFKEYQWILDEKNEECSSKEDYVKLQSLRAWVEMEILELKNRLTELYKNAIAKKGTLSGSTKIFE
jgi:hypothetical protein